MKYIIIIIFFTLIPNCAKAQSDNQIGVYMKSDSKNINNITPSVVTFYKVNSTLPAFGEKPSMSLYIDGEYATNYTKSRQPEFFFFFPNDSSKSISPVDVSNMIRNYPFSYGKSPKDFYLIRLFKEGKKRAYRIEKEKFVSFYNNYKVFDIDTIPFTVIPISSGSFKVILNSDLPIGDYGFIYKHPTPYTGIVYDFNIE